jgi:hypothetical protein
MSISRLRVTVVAALLAFAFAGCGGHDNAAVPPGAAASDLSVVTPADTTSILKKLKKDVTIGSTVDPGNGDTGPHGISIAQASYGKLKQGQILVCNFEDKAGTAGDGTTIDVFDAKAGSKPTTFVKSAHIKGCSGDALAGGNQVYATGMTSKLMAHITPAGVPKKTWSKPISEAMTDADAPQIYEYSSEFIFIGNADDGGVVSYSFGGYGQGVVTEVIGGFPVNKGSGWSALGPSGLAYWCGVPPGSFMCTKKGKIPDELFVADGACNAVVEIDKASELLLTHEIVVQPSCKTFKCKYAKFKICGKLVKAGAPLNAPFAETLLPNGNIIVANTKGGNTLVEMTPTGQVLDTKVVDKSKTAGIFGLASGGTSDSNTTLFYTDKNTNTLHELEQ